MRTIKIFLVLAFVLAVSASDANACSCFVGSKPCADYWKSTAVFVGTVTYSTRTTFKHTGGHDYPGRLVRFSIEQSFRGVSGKEVEVFTGLGGGDCGYGFRIGGTYLVYARGDGGQLSTGICSRTRPLSDASEDLAYFKSLATAKPGGTIFGEVKRMDRNAAFEDRLRPVADARIVLEGPSKRVEVISDQKGNYKVSELPPGKYKVRVELPEGLSIHNPEQEVEVFDRGCAQTGFWVEPDTRITGLVYDAQGQPVSDLLIELMPAEEKSNTGSMYIKTDNAGRYEMKLVQPGRYLLGVRIFGSGGASYVPFPKTYFPGVSEESRSTVLEVVEGQRLELADLILPQRLVERTLNGVVVNAAGQPLRGATVWLKENEYADHDMPYRRETDEEGRFTFKVFDGFQYKLTAYLDIAKGERKQAAQTLRISANTETVRMVLK